MDRKKIPVKILTNNLDVIYNGRQDVFEFLDGVEISIGEHKGPAVIYISCVNSVANKDGRFQTHPNKLVGTQNCNALDGVCKVNLDDGCTHFKINKIGVKIAPNNEISSILKARYKRGIDPYECRLDHIHQKNPDLNAIRLCFQVVVEKRLLKPVSSKSIDLTKTLKICGMSSLSSPTEGNKSITLLYEPVNNDDIAVRFYKKVKGIVAWESFGVLSSETNRRRCAIKFKSPPFTMYNIFGSVSVLMQLYRPSDGASSAPIEFIYKASSVDSKKNVAFKRNI